MAEEIVHTMHFRINENNHKLWFDLASESLKPLFKAISLRVKNFEDPDPILDMEESFMIIRYEFYLKENQEVLSYASDIFKEYFNAECNFINDKIVTIKVKSLYICNEIDEMENLGKSHTAINIFNL